MTRGVRQELRRGLWTAGFRGQHAGMLNRFLGGRRDSRRWCRRGKPLVDELLLEVSRLAYLDWTAQGQPALNENYAGERFFRGVLKQATRVLRAHRTQKEEEGATAAEPTEPVPGPGIQQLKQEPADRPCQPVAQEGMDYGSDLEIIEAPTAAGSAVIHIGSSDSDEILG